MFESSSDSDDEEWDADDPFAVLVPKIRRISIPHLYSQSGGCVLCSRGGDTIRFTKAKQSDRPNSRLFPIAYTHSLPELVF
jgi:hypothetical protein